MKTKSLDIQHRDIHDKVIMIVLCYDVKLKNNLMSRCMYRFVWVNIKIIPHFLPCLCFCWLYFGAWLWVTWRAHLRTTGATEPGDCVRCCARTFRPYNIRGPYIKWILKDEIRMLLNAEPESILERAIWHQLIWHFLYVIYARSCDGLEIIISKVRFVIWQWTL